jgi:hypothetical protein
MDALTMTTDTTSTESGLDVAHLAALLTAIEWRTITKSLAASTSKRAFATPLSTSQRTWHAGWLIGFED